MSVKVVKMRHDENVPVLLGLKEQNWSSVFYLTRKKTDLKYFKLSHPGRSFIKIFFFKTR